VDLFGNIQSSMEHNDLQNLLDSLDEGPLGTKKDWQWERSIQTIGNTNRTKNDKTPVYIDVISGRINTSRLLKKELNIPTTNSIKALANKQRLYIADPDTGLLSAARFPTTEGMFLMLYADYKKYVKKHGKEPMPTFEYPFFKEVNSGFIGNAVMMREKWPKWTPYHVDIKYEKGRTKYENNAFKDYNFTRVSTKVKNKSFLYPEKEYFELMKKETLTSL